MIIITSIVIVARATACDHHACEEENNQKGS